MGSKWEGFRKFRKIYVVEPRFDTDLIERYADSIEFLTNGTNHVSNLQSMIRRNLEEFNPETDALVTMGRAVACLITGLVVRDLWPSGRIVYGIYRGDSYEFVAIDHEVIP